MPVIARTIFTLSVLVALLAPLAGCGDRAANRPAAAADPADTTRTVPQWVFEPGVKFGPLDATSSESDLTAAYGAGAVRAADVPLGEGEISPGTEVFGDDPHRRFLVTWRDTLERRNPDRVMITGDSTLWHSAAGVTLGVTLKRLEQINGGPFTLLGFGWDYGGTVSSWDGGTLAPFERRAFVTLAAGADRPDSAFQSVLGDRPFPSSHASMQALDPRVQRIVVRFE